jgi:hypothetical protein
VYEGQLAQAASHVDQLQSTEKDQVEKYEAMSSVTKMTKLACKCKQNAFKIYSVP